MRASQSIFFDFRKWVRLCVSSRLFANTIVWPIVLVSNNFKSFRFFQFREKPKFLIDSVSGHTFRFDHYVFGFDCPRLGKAHNIVIESGGETRSDAVSYEAFYKLSV